MKILFINVVCGIRSTGRICTDLAAELEKEGHEVRIAYGRENVPEKYEKYAIRIGSDTAVKIHGLEARLFDGCGRGSRRATRSFLQWAEEFDPDVLWLHNIHGYYLNVFELFDWIKSRPKMKVKWTLHDCWAFTGHCSYFTAVKCDKWKTGCEKCPQKKAYPASILLDNSKRNYRDKKRCFTGVKDMELITPSRWLADLTRESFLKEYPVSVVYNRIDRSVFKPSPGDFRKKYGIGDGIMILGVASVWEPRKGLEDFYRLAKMLDPRYVIVLVGLDASQTDLVPQKIGLPAERTEVGNSTVYAFGGASTENRENGAAGDIPKTKGRGIVISQGAENIYAAITGREHPEPAEDAKDCVSRIICIPRTANAAELAEIYTAADFFVNPTYEDNYPTVNLEAKACGTTVITYDTGGAAETLRDDTAEEGETE